MQTHIASIAGVSLPPFVALLLTIALVVFLLRRDLRERPNVTGALWLPIAWMVLIGSRSPTHWLSVFGLAELGSTDEGNPIDALIYLALIIAGLWVLNRRQASVSEFVRNNGWIVVFLLYCSLAILWSDYPFIAFKRWIKIIGHPVMVLILFTEPDFDEAVIRLIKRTAYVLVPFSILLIKYYPQIGRVSTDWGGVMNRGVALSKNSLGSDCMIFGLFFLWHFLRTWQMPRDIIRRNELRLILFLGVMIAWLMWKAHSATSLWAMLIGATLMLLVGQQWVNKRLIGTYVISAVIAVVAADLAFGILDHFVDFTGHGATLIGRSELWGELLALRTDPIFGVGFESLWLDDLASQLPEGRAWVPNEAHNGYLETYLNLGLIGLFLLVALLIATFRKARVDLLTNIEWGRLRFGFLVAVILANWTEAKFRGLSVLWFAFYIIAVDYPKLTREASENDVATGALDEELEPVYASAEFRNRGTHGATYNDIP
jgi:exopolysaccharide production protein ExoQ